MNSFTGIRRVDFKSIFARPGDIYICVVAQRALTRTRVRSSKFSTVGLEDLSRYCSTRRVLNLVDTFTRARGLEGKARFTPLTIKAPTPKCTGSTILQGIKVPLVQTVYTRVKDQNLLDVAEVTRVTAHEERAGTR